MSIKHGWVLTDDVSTIPVHVTLYGIRPHPCKGSRVKSHLDTTSREEISATRFLEFIRPSNTTQSKSDEVRLSFSLLPDSRQCPTCGRPLCRSPSRDSGLCYSRCFSKLSLIHKPDMSLRCPWSPSKSGNGFSLKMICVSSTWILSP